jgi:hypothetical protein
MLRSGAAAFPKRCHPRILQPLAVILSEAKSLLFLFVSELRADDPPMNDCAINPADQLATPPKHCHPERSVARLCLFVREAEDATRREGSAVSFSFFLSKVHKIRPGVRLFLAALPFRSLPRRHFRRKLH